MPHCFNPFTGALSTRTLRGIEEAARAVEPSVCVVTLNGDAHGPRGHMTMTDYGPPFSAGRCEKDVTEALRKQGLWPVPVVHKTLWQVLEHIEGQNPIHWSIEAYTPEEALRKAKALVNDSCGEEGYALPTRLEIHADGPSDSRIAPEDCLDDGGTLLAAASLEEICDEYWT